MLSAIAERVLTHQSDFCQSNSVVVEGRGGALLIDPGIREAEMVCLANDVSAAGQTVSVAFSTHPHWDHVLWHSRLGTARRYGTARCADVLGDLLRNPDWPSRIAGFLPPDISDQIPLDQFGRVTGVPSGADRVPWAGAEVRIVEHQAHVAGHAALLIPDSGVLVAGDMLSDVLIPLLNIGGADPIGDYLDALRRLEQTADEVDVFVPGHGSVGGADEMRLRIDRDRAYVSALRGSGDIDDPRLGPLAKPGWEWVTGVHERQLGALASQGQS